LPDNNSGGPAAPPANAPASAVAFNSQSLADFNALWNRQTGYAGQWSEDVHDVVWSEMLASDPVGESSQPIEKQAASGTGTHPSKPGGRRLESCRARHFAPRGE